MTSLMRHTPKIQGSVQFHGEKPPSALPRVVDRWSPSVAGGEGAFTVRFQIAAASACNKIVANNRPIFRPLPCKTQCNKSACRPSFDACIRLETASLLRAARISQRGTKSFCEGFIGCRCNLI